MSHQYMQPPIRPCFPPFVQWTGTNYLLSPPECRELIKLGDHGLREGSIGNGDDGMFHVEHEYRCVKTRALWPHEGFEWLYDRLREKIRLANDDHFRFDITGIDEGVQFLRYDAPETEGEPAGKYDWHQDFGGGPSSLRKLSMVVQLSPGSDYAGCELRLFTDCEFAPLPAEQGAAIIFPSWTPHMVSPITKGTRYALAIWVSGPQFR